MFDNPKTTNKISYHIIFKKKLYASLIINNYIYKILHIIKKIITVGPFSIFLYNKNVYNSQYFNI